MVGSSKEEHEVLHIGQYNIISSIWVLVYQHQTEGTGREDVVLDRGDAVPRSLHQSLMHL